MAKTCKICGLTPRTRKAIDRALIEGASSERVAKRFKGVSMSSVYRHSKHVLAPTAEARRLAAGQEVLERSSASSIQDLLDEHWDVYREARAAGQLANANQALREVAANIERLAVLSGEMAQAKLLNLSNVTIDDKFIRAFLETLAERPSHIIECFGRECHRLKLCLPSMTINFVTPSNNTVDAAG